MQVLEQAVKATGSLDDGKLADYIHKSAFNTIVGEIRFDEKGEWATPRLLMVQFQNVQGSSLDQYRTTERRSSSIRRNTRTANCSSRSQSNLQRRGMEP